MAVAALAVVERDGEAVALTSAGVRGVAGDGMKTGAAVAVAGDGMKTAAEAAAAEAAAVLIADRAGEPTIADRAGEPTIADLAEESAESWCRAWTSLLGYNHPFVGWTPPEFC